MILMQKSLFQKTLSDGGTSLKLVYDSASYDFIIPFSDRASVENAVAVASVCLALGTDASGNNFKWS